MMMLPTREEWLQALVGSLRPVFSETGINIPTNIRVACGWPRVRGGTSRHVIGQCWPTVVSKDGTSEIFVSPVLDDGVEVGAVLVHELIHAIDDCRNGHRAAFRKIALAVGLEGPMRSTVAGPYLRQRLNVLCAKLGSYPHACLGTPINSPKQADPAIVPSSGKSQGTRLRKVVCNRPDCGYAIWTTRRWLTVGTPLCACGSIMREKTAEAESV